MMERVHPIQAIAYFTYQEAHPLQRVQFYIFSIHSSEQERVQQRLLTDILVVHCTVYNILCEL